MFLVVRVSVDGEDKNAGITRAEAAVANMTAITVVMRILAAVGCRIWV